MSGGRWILSFRYPAECPEMCIRDRALAAQIEPEINRYREAGLPAIILIPGISGNTGKGILAVKKSVEQAVGSDIIFNGQ